MKLFIRTNGKHIVNISTINIHYKDGFQEDIFIVNLVIIQKWRFKYYE